MPTPRSNAVDYIEIPSRDVSKSKAFFEALVGWKFTEYGPDYVSFDDGRLSGGFFTSDKISRVDSGAALVIIHAENLEELRERALKLGASITRDIFSFPGGRRFHFAEPGGSEFSIWTDK